MPTNKQLVWLYNKYREVNGKFINDEKLNEWFSKTMDKVSIQRKEQINRGEC